jgi:hypothetical protein
VIEVFHTNQCRGDALQIPILATGNEQWLGDAYYFWQDYEFAEEWGYNRICYGKEYKKRELTHFDIYDAVLNISFPSDDVLDTVYNNENYKQFMINLEKFAMAYKLQFGEKPNLEEFNDFIKDFNIWGDIKAIRFQDLPTNSKRDYLKIINFFYKKRIQIAVYDVKIITKFVRTKSFKCKTKYK